MDTVGQRIKSIRNMRYMTQAEVSQRAGLNPSLYRSYECGDRNPKLDTLKKIATALDVDVAFLKPINTELSVAMLALLFNYVEKGYDIISPLIPFLEEAEWKFESMTKEEFLKWLIDYEREDNMMKLTENEKEIIRELDDPTYTVEYLEQWINRDDNVQVNAVAALSAMGAKGYYAAVKRMAERQGKF